jgi:hypothetical protein
MKTLLIASAAAIGAVFFVANGPVSAQSLSSCQETAKENIDWIVYQNLHFRQTLEDAIRSGVSPYDALLMTERDNPIGTAAFRTCSDYTKSYLNSLNLGAPVAAKPAQG